MATANFWADDVPAAVAWYTELLGVEPYFIRPEAPAPAQYVEFRFGDLQAELGIVDRAFGPPRPTRRAAPCSTGTSMTCRRPSIASWGWARPSSSR